MFSLVILYIMYRAVIQSIENLKNDFSTRNLIREVLNTIGEGELQDNMTIALLLFVLNNKKICRICNKPFSVVAAPVRRDNPDDQEVLSSISSLVPATSEDVV